jgi:hypothetical protein
MLVVDTAPRRRPTAFKVGQDPYHLRLQAGRDGDVEDRHTSGRRLRRESRRTHLGFANAAVAVSVSLSIRSRRSRFARHSVPQDEKRKPEDPERVVGAQLATLEEDVELLGEAVAPLERSCDGSKCANDQHSDQSRELLLFNNSHLAASPSK